MGFLGAVSSFINQYYINPLAYPSKYAPYNVVNTATFAILALIASYFIYNGLKERKVAIDSRFYWAIVPFVIFGSVVRVLDDAGLLPRSVSIFGFTAYPFVTPVLYSLVFIVCIACLWLSLRLSKGSGKPEEFTKLLRACGWGLFILAFLPLLPLLSNFTALAYVAGLSALGAAAYLAIWRIAGRKWDKVGLFTAWSQCLDGAATFVGVSVYGYSEQHVLGNAIFAFFGTPLAFFILKALFGLAVVWIAENEFADPKESQLACFVLLLVTVFGVGPGMRDTLRMVART